jgi:transcription elongation factor Elf1
VHKLDRATSDPTIRADHAHEGSPKNGGAMDVCRAVESSPLQVECPHCSHVEDDEFELLDQDQVQGMHCANCGHDFYFVIMECAGCGTECVFSWMRRPESARFEHLTCASCGQPYRHHEATSGSPDSFA